MPRPLWKGAISFGMVSIPIRLYTATDEKDVRFNLLHASDRSRIRNKRFCIEEDTEVEGDEIVRGYEIAPHQYVIVDEEDFEKVPVNSTHAIEITEFVNLENIDPVYYQKTYYLEPEEIGAKPFALLRRALQETGRVAIAKITLRQKEHLCTLRVYENTIALETMFYADEIRSTSDLAVPGEDVQVSDRELQMAKSLVEMLSDDFDASEYQDNYREALIEIIRKKAEGEVITAPRPAPAKVTDLMEALRASVDEARKRKEAGQAPAAAEASEDEDELARRRRRRRAG
jgi:DNA end-binding protein Ku